MIERVIITLSSLADKYTIFKLRLFFEQLDRTRREAEIKMLQTLTWRD